MNGATLFVALLIAGSFLVLVRVGARSAGRPVRPMKEVAEPNSAVRVLTEKDELDDALARARRGPHAPDDWRSLTPLPASESQRSDSGHADATHANH